MLVRSYKYDSTECKLELIAPYCLRQEHRLALDSTKQAQERTPTLVE